MQWLIANWILTVGLSVIANWESGEKGDGKCAPGVKTHKITPSQHYTLKLSAAILGFICFTYWWWGLGRTAE